MAIDEVNFVLDKRLSPDLEKAIMKEASKTQLVKAPAKQELWQDETKDLKSKELVYFNKTYLPLAITSITCATAMVSLLTAGLLFPALGIYLLSAAAIMGAVAIITGSIAINNYSRYQNLLKEAVIQQCLLDFQKQCDQLKQLQNIQQDYLALQQQHRALIVDSSRSSKREINDLKEQIRALETEIDKLRTNAASNLLLPPVEIPAPPPPPLDTPEAPTRKHSAPPAQHHINMPKPDAARSNLMDSIVSPEKKPALKKASERKLAPKPQLKPQEKTAMQILSDSMTDIRSVVADSDDESDSDNDNDWCE